jgi:membrane associated rhomboid family serine protease
MYKNNMSYVAPQTGTGFILLVNLALFAICIQDARAGQINSVALYNYGALHHDALVSHEYWRLIAYAFLHGGGAHLLMNMFCLLAWGGIVEQRVGATYFLAIYLAGAVAGGVVSIYSHEGQFMTVGASGAIAGVVGAMLCLALLGKLELSAQFFIVTIGVNVLIAANLPRIDWASHLGGFTAGVAVCATLDAVEMINRSWLRCKFPEFVKLNIAIFIFCGYVFLLSTPFALKAGLAPGTEEWARLAAVALTALALIKGADLLLSRTRGLAAVAFGVAVMAGALPFLLGAPLQRALSLGCEKARAAKTLSETGFARAGVEFVCDGSSSVNVALGGVLFCGAMILLWGQMRRGWKDVGFVAEGHRAERRRRRGL